MERDLAVLAVLGLPVRDRSPHLPWSEAERVRTEALLPARFVQLHPFSRWSYKDLAPAILLPVLQRLAREGIPVVLTGADDPAERARAADILREMGAGITNLAGRLSLSELAHVSSRSALYMGSDTAAMHIAAAVGTPVVAWFGPSLTASWGPWDGTAGDSPYQNRGGIQRMGRHVVLQAAEPCVPCNRRGCEDSGRSRCLEVLSSAVILREAARVLGQPLD